MILNIATCIECGRFMNCDEIDARRDVERDDICGTETVAWTCGPCVRRDQES